MVKKNILRQQADKPLRRLAKGKPCMIRIPGVCNPGPDNETVVLAHYRLPGTGIGRKSHDLIASWTCHACHDAVDGRNPNAQGRTLMKLYHLEGVMRTINSLIDNQLIEIHIRSE